MRTRLNSRKLAPPSLPYRARKFLRVKLCRCVCELTIRVNSPNAKNIWRLGATSPSIRARTYGDPMSERTIAASPTIIAATGKLSLTRTDVKVIPACARRISRRSVRCAKRTKCRYSTRRRTWTTVPAEMQARVSCPSPRNVSPVTSREISLTAESNPVDRHVVPS